MRQLKLQGLDSFSVHKLEEFWKNYNPRKDKPKILGISISTSNRCNLRCIYCYSGVNKKPFSNELSLDEQRDIISQAKFLGAETVIICGDGEPTMDKNLLGIISHAKSLGMFSVIVTNANIFGDDELCKKIHDINSINFLKDIYNSNASIIAKVDSLVEDKYDTIVGKQKAYKYFMCGINRAIEMGFTLDKRDKEVTRLSLSSVVMKNNISELMDLKKFAESIRAQYICKLPSLVGNALENVDSMFEVSEYEKIRKKILAYTAKRETLMVDTPRCMAWHYGPTIDCCGEVRECYTSPCSKDARIGNIREYSLYELIQRRIKLYDITNKDFCPVKSRINKAFERRNLNKIWTIEPNCIGCKDKIKSF